MAPTTGPRALSPPRSGLPTSRHDHPRRGSPPEPTSAEAGPRPHDEPATESQPSLPERLLAAREAKGVDLYRAERDTKIRARYLGALERGDYRELPGVGLHEGLPPQLRSVPGPRPGRDPPPVAPRAGRRRRPERAVDQRPASRSPPRATGFTFSLGLVVAAVLTVGGHPVRRLPRLPAVPLLAAARGRGDRPVHAVSTVDETATVVHPARDLAPGGTRVDRGGRPRAAGPGNRRRRAGPGRPTSSCAAGRTSSASARPTRTPARTSRSRSRSSSRSRSRRSSRRP